MGNSLAVIREFPDDARQQIGYQLDQVQRGRDPDNWKPMPDVGVGAREIRIRDADGHFRVIYVARFGEAVYVLNAFQKKTKKTPKSNLQQAKKYYRGINREQEI